MNQSPVYQSKLYTSINGFCITADAVALTIQDDVLKVLLIERKEDPCAGKWAIPGGFVNGQVVGQKAADEKVEDSCKRELKEETGLVPFYLEQLKVYSKKGRDPREALADSPVRIWSVCHLVCVKPSESAVKAGDDAKEAKWVPMSEALKMNLAFDHSEALKDAYARYNSNSKFYDKMMSEPFWDTIKICVAVASFIVGLIIV